VSMDDRHSSWESLSIFGCSASPNSTWRAEQEGRWARNPRCRPPGPARCPPRCECPWGRRRPPVSGSIDDHRGHCRRRGHGPHRARIQRPCLRNAVVPTRTLSDHLRHHQSTGAALARLEHSSLGCHPLDRARFDLVVADLDRSGDPVNQFQEVVVVERARRAIVIACGRTALNCAAVQSAVRLPGFSPRYGIHR